MFPCHNQGTCNSKNGSNETCSCPEGYTGEYCDFEGKLRFLFWDILSD